MLPLLWCREHCSLAMFIYGLASVRGKGTEGSQNKSTKGLIFKATYSTKYFVGCSQWNRNSLCKRCLLVAILTWEEVCYVQVIRRCVVRGSGELMSNWRSCLHCMVETEWIAFPNSLARLDAKSVIDSLAVSLISLKFFKNMKKWAIYIKKNTFKFPFLIRCMWHGSGRAVMCGLESCRKTTLTLNCQTCILDDPLAAEKYFYFLFFFFLSRLVIKAWMPIRNYVGDTYLWRKKAGQIWACQSCLYYLRSTAAMPTLNYLAVIALIKYRCAHSSHHLQREFL